MSEIRDMFSEAMEDIFRNCIDEDVRAGDYGKALRVNNLLYDRHYGKYKEALKAKNLAAIEEESEQLDRIFHQASNLLKLINRRSK